MPCLLCRPWQPAPAQGRPSSIHRCDGTLVGLASANADRPLQRQHEDLPVAALACASALAQGIDRRLYEWIRDGDLEADLVRKTDLPRRAPVCLDSVELPAVALDPA